MTLLLYVLMALGCLSIYKYRRRNMCKLAAAIPVARDSIPILGIGHKLIGNSEDIMTSLQEFSYESMEHNGIIGGWLCHILYFVSTNPADSEFVLKKCLEKDELVRFMRSILGYAGLFAPVSIWRRRRKIMIPAFSPRVVESFGDIISEHSQRLASNLNKQVGKGMFSSFPFISAATLDSISESVLGVKINAQGSGDCKFLNAIMRSLSIVCKRTFSLWLHPEWIFRLFPASKELENTTKTLNKFVEEVIRSKRDKMESEKISKTGNEYGSSKKITFLDMLIKLSGDQNGYTDIELREELLTLIMAGTDTSAVAVGLTLELLAKYPEIQEKVYQELYEVFEDSERPLVKQDLEKLEYMDRVVKESLRLFPPVPFIIRKVLEDTTLPSGRILPAGTGIVISIWGLHRNPTYWDPNADHFDPDRFLPERFSKQHADSFMPFSSGPRNCPGYRFGMMSIKSSLSAILRRYKVTSEPESGPIPRIRVQMEVMLKSVTGSQVALERRCKLSKE